MGLGGEATRPMPFLEFSEDDGRETVLQHIASSNRSRYRFGTGPRPRRWSTSRISPVVVVRAPVGVRPTGVGPGHGGRCSPFRSKSRRVAATRP
jgi:hypothetical protein